MLRIDSRTYDPDHFVNKFKRSIKYILISLIILLMVISIFIKDASYQNVALGIFYLLFVLFVFMTFYSLIAPQGRDFSGQYIELHEKKFCAIELYSQAILKVKKEELMQTYEIYYDEIESVENMEKDVNSNRVIGLNIYMKKDYSLSTLTAPEKGLTVSLSVYGYNPVEFFELMNEIKEKVNK